MRRKILWLIVAGLTFVIGLAFAWFVNVSQQSKEQSEVSPINLDYMRASYCNRSETPHDFGQFWTEFQSAVRTDDKAKLFSMIEICNFYWQESKLDLKTVDKLYLKFQVEDMKSFYELGTLDNYFFEDQNDFVRNYDRIFTKRVRREILETKSPKGSKQSYFIEWLEKNGSATLNFNDSGNGFKFDGLEIGPP